MVSDQKILKAVLMLRRCGNKYQTKEEQIAEQKEWLKLDPEYADRFDSWIDGLREELAKTPEQREEESRRFCEELAEREAELLYQELHDNHYCPSCTAGDYSPGNPWNAPGMSIHDFI